MLHNNTFMRIKVVCWYILLRITKRSNIINNYIRIDLLSDLYETAIAKKINCMERTKRT